MPPEGGPSWHRGPSDSPGPSEKKLKRTAPSSSSTTPSYSQGEVVPVKKSRQSTRDVSFTDIGAGLSGSDAILLQRVIYSLF